MDHYLYPKSSHDSRTNTLTGIAFSESLSFGTIEEDDSVDGDPKLIGIIGDEDTCVGFILAGIGHIDENMTPNYFVVDKKTDDFELELVFLDMIERSDIGLVLITKEAAQKIAPVLNMHTGLDPTVMIIPGHNGPFEIELPQAVKNIEEKRIATCLLTANGRRVSGGSTTSIKTIDSLHGAALAKKLSTHSIRSNRSCKSLKL